MSPDAVIVHTLPEASVMDPLLVGVSTIWVDGGGTAVPPVTVKAWGPEVDMVLGGWLVFTPL